MNECGPVLLSALAIAFSLAYLPMRGAEGGPSGRPLSEREQAGLHGPVKSFIEEVILSAWVASDGKEVKGASAGTKMDYDVEGRLIAKLFRNADGTVWATRYSYGAAGKLLMVSEGRVGDPAVDSVYAYDEQGRLASIDDGIKPPITFTYEHGQKMKKQVARAEDYQANVAMSGSPFQAADRPPNLPGGGTASTTYSEDDRPIEVRVLNAQGELVSRVLRSYDAAGRVSEEKQIVEDPLAMFPADLRARIQQSSDSAVAEVRKQITALMGGHQGFSSVIYTYDDRGRLKETLRQTFNQEDSIVTTYNEHGDEASTRTVRAGGTAEQSVSPTNSEERCSYEYDAHGNWTQKIITTLGTDGSIASTRKVRRILTYF